MGSEKRASIYRIMDSLESENIFIEANLLFSIFSSNGLNLDSLTWDWLLYSDVNLPFDRISWWSFWINSLSLNTSDSFFFCAHQYIESVIASIKPLLRARATTISEAPDSFTEAYTLQIKSCSLRKSLITVLEMVVLNSFLIVFWTSVEVKERLCLSKPFTKLFISSENFRLLPFLLWSYKPSIPNFSIAFL